MRNLLLFLQRNHFFFLALLLEIFSLILLFHYNDYQNTLFHKVSLQTTGSISRVTDHIAEYFSLRQTNQMLATEIARLHSERAESYNVTDLNKHFRRDTLLKLQYRYISAKVINNTTQRRNNFFLIDKGQIHGVEKHMGVISANGVAGQVVNVSRNFSWVMSVLNRDSRISGKFLKNSQLVNIEWNGFDYRYGEVKEIPKHVDVRKGDSIVTSGNSDIFPRSVMIGTINSVILNEEGNFNEATINFATDFNSLEFVEVIIDLMKKEKDSVKIEINPDQR